MVTKTRGKPVGCLAFFHGYGIVEGFPTLHPDPLMRMTSSFFLRLALVAGLATHAGARADSVIYKCVDKATGRIEFTDVKKAGCQALDLPGYYPSPTPAPVRAAPPVSQREGTARPAAVPAAPAPSAAGFPRVDTATQRARDDDRRGILEDELRAEEKKLVELKRNFNNGEPERQGNEKNYAKYQERVAQMRDDIGRSEKNIEALKREISNIR